MRTQGTALLLLALLGGLAVWLALRPRQPAADLALAPGLATGAAPTPTATAAPSDATAAAVTSAAPNQPTTPWPSALRGVEPLAPAPLGRPLRVVALGWGPLVPALVANGGTTPNPESRFVAHGLEVALTHAKAPVALERALAWGGGHERGADLAIAPLPVLLTSLARLSLLDLRILYVVAWSRGAEALLGPTTTSLSEPAPTDTATLVGTPSSPATFLGLFALDLSGIRPSQVRLLSPATTDLPATALLAFDRWSSAGSVTPPPGVELLSTREASRLIPYVVVAPRELLDRHRPALVSWLQGWLEGAAQLGRDGPATTARTLGASPGAPEPWELLQALSRIELAGLGDNVELMGLSGRPALTIDGLVERSWELLQGAQLVPAGPPPQTHPELVAAAVRAGLPLDRYGVERAGSVAGRCAAGTHDAAPTRLTHRPGGTLDRRAGLAGELALLAEIFRGAALRVRSPRDAAAAQELIARSRDRFELDPPCPLQPAAAADPAETKVIIEVLGAP